jgi:hypothetical protein
MSNESCVLKIIATTVLVLDQDNLLFQGSLKALQATVREITIKLLFSKKEEQQLQAI